MRDTGDRNPPWLWLFILGGWRMTLNFWRRR
jgi:hypothetical protein